MHHPPSPRHIFAAALLLSACADADARPITFAGGPSPDAEADADEPDPNEADDADMTEDPPPDLPAEEDPEPMPPAEPPGPPEPPGDFETLEHVVTMIAEREATLTAFDDEGRNLGWVRLRHDDQRRLWIESAYHDGFAWVGLHPHTYEVEFHRSTLAPEVLDDRVGLIGDHVQTRPYGDDRTCGLYIATAVRECSLAAETGEASKDGCPTIMHRAACKCLAPYPNEYVCL